MANLKDNQIQGLKALFGVVNDTVVRNLESALSEDAAQGGPLSVVRDLLSKESCERRVRSMIFGPVAPLCRQAGLSAVAFPPKTVPLLWIALQESDREKAAEAELAALRPLELDAPPDPVFDELCLAAAQGLRCEAPAFQAANDLLNSKSPDGGAAFAAYLDLAPLARESLQRLPNWVARMSEERAAAARLAYKDAVALSDDAGPQFFEIIFAHLDEPWQVLKVMSAIMDRPGDRYAEASELARFGHYILDDIDRRLAAFKAFDPANGAAAGKAAADALHVASQEIAEFETSIELSREGPWGMRVIAQKKLLAQSAEARLEQIAKGLDAALPLRSVKFGKGTRGFPKLTADPDAAALKRAEGLMAFFDQSRSSAAQSGYGAARAKAAEMIEERLDQYVEDMLELLRSEEEQPMDRIHAYLEVTAELMGAARDEKAAQIVRRRAAAA